MSVLNLRDARRVWVGQTEARRLWIGPGITWTDLGWAPADLYASGANGAWLDPSDLSTLFQDAAGTVPVTASGQPVGMVLDKSGNGNHHGQDEASARPIYHSAGGLHWLEFDGTTELVGGSFDVTGDMYFGVGVSVDDRAGIGQRLWSSTPGSTQPNAIGLYLRTDVVQDFQVAMRMAGSNIVGRAHSRNEYVIGAPFVGEGYHEAGAMHAAVNGGAVASGSYDGSGVSGPVPLVLGGPNQSKFFGGFYVADPVSDEMKAEARAYLSEASGL